MTRARKTKRASVYVVEERFLIDGPEWNAIVSLTRHYRKNAIDEMRIFREKHAWRNCKYRVRRYDRVDRAGK